MPIWDPLVPAERVIQRGLSHLPPWISRWLGYRGTNLPPSRNWIVCLWGFIGAFGGVASIIAVFAHTNFFHNIHLVPPIVASFVSIDHMGLKAALLTTSTGCFRNSLLRRHRCPSGATTIPYLWSLLQRTYWRNYGNHLPVQFARRSLSTTPVVGSRFVHCIRSRCHAPYQDDPSTCRSNRLDPVRRSSHLGPTMVLFASSSAIIDDRSGDSLRRQQSATTIPQVLGRADSAGTCCAGCACACT